MMLGACSILVSFLLLAAHGEKCSNNTFDETPIKISSGATLTTTVAINGCLNPQTVSYSEDACLAITIENSTIPVVYADAISDFQQTLAITIRDNEIQTIKEGAFANLPRVEVFELSNDGIEFVESGVFANMPSLSALDLSRNKLQDFSQLAFRNLPKLAFLNLEQNQLQYMRPDWFSGTPRLKVLILSTNLIRQIPRASFSKLPSLTILKLDGNVITHVDSEAFEGLPNLHQLFLSNNQIKALDDGFSPLAKLGGLFLANNDITRVSGGFLRTLSALGTFYHLDLTSNPLQCSCFDKILQWSCDNGIDVKLEYNEEKPVCVVPATDNQLCTGHFLEFWSDYGTHISNDSCKDVKTAPLEIRHAYCRRKDNYQKIVLDDDGQSFGSWAKPSGSKISIYIYNVTNADEFLENGSKPTMDEVGPYVYRVTWRKKNGAYTNNLEKSYMFDEEASSGSEDDTVVVPNVPMLSTTSLSKDSAGFLRRALDSITEILKLKAFVAVSVGELLWGYEDPLLKLAKDTAPPEKKVPYEQFGFFYNKNGSTTDDTTVFTAPAADISKLGFIDTYDGKFGLDRWLTNTCSPSVGNASLSEDSTLFIYDKHFCQTLPLKFEKEIPRGDGGLSYRFTPPLDVFASAEEKPENMCNCLHDPPCAPFGFFNLSHCQYDSPMFASFPHFYLADDSYRTAFQGISPPDPEKHMYYLDANPAKGNVLSARTRIQINLAVTHVEDIKPVAKFPDIMFPIIWFEEAVN